jgi:hypothetical protein
MKPRRTVAIKKLREAGMSEAEIQDALAQLRNELGISAETANRFDSVENLPAVIDSADEARGTRNKKRPWPKKPNRDENYRSTDKEKVAEYDSKLAANPERRCVGTNELGERCRKFAIPGGRVCRNHGGATRHVKEKARIRVEMASDRLVGKLIEIAHDDTRPASVQLEAIKDALNRAGLTKPAQVEVGPIKQYEEVFDDIMTGSRAEYRESSVRQRDPMADLNEAGHEPIASDHVDSHFDSEQPPPNHPAPAGSHDSSHRYEDDRPYRPDSDRYRVTSPITGDDAIRLANEANGFVPDDEDYSIVDVLDAHLPPRRALPPGRSFYRD